jgi:isoleucyl-tRNA synthetase
MTGTGPRQRIEVPQTVSEDGSFYPHVPLFAGKRVLRPTAEGDADPPSSRAEGGVLLAKAS